MPETCQRARCRMPATHTPVLEIPAKGHDWGAHEPAVLHTGIRACLGHATRWFANDALPEASKQAVRDSLAAIGRAEPDFKRARCKAVALNSAEAAQAEVILNGPTRH